MKLDGVQPASPGTVPPGIYPCRLDDLQGGKSRGDNPQIELSWTVLEGEYTGAEIRDWITYTEAGIDFFLSKVAALYESTGKDRPEGDVDFDGLVKHAKSLVGGLASVHRRKDEKGFIPEGKTDRIFPTRVAGYSKASPQTVATVAARPVDTDLPF